MPWSGGNFTRTDGTRTGSTVWQQAKAALVKILALAHDTHDQDLATGINNCLTKDGQNKPTDNIDFDGNKITNMADGANDGDCLLVNQVGDGLTFTGGKVLVKAKDSTIAISSSGISVSSSALDVFPFTAQGQILYANVSANATALAVGTAGYILQTGGASANPSWVKRTEVILTDWTSFSGADNFEVDIGTLASTDSIRLELIDVQPSTSDAYLYMQLGLGGAVYETNVYYGHNMLMGTLADTYLGKANAGTGSIQLTGIASNLGVNSSGGGLCFNGRINIHNAGSTTYYKYGYFDNSYTSPTATTMCKGVLLCAGGVGALSKIKVKTSGGNFAGKYRIIKVQ